MKHISGDERQSANPLSNIFSSLLGYTPNSNLTPRENFLTSAASSLLAQCDEFAAALCSRLSGGTLHNCKNIKIFSQLRWSKSKSNRQRQQGAYFDIFINGNDADGQSFAICIEAKWNSKFDVSQIRRYSKLLSSSKKFRQKYIALLSPRSSDVQACTRQFDDRSHPKSVKIGAFNWLAVAEILENLKQPNDFQIQLANFIRSEVARQPMPISRNLITQVGSKRSLSKSLSGICGELKSVIQTPDWLDDTSDIAISNGWGRSCIWFGENQVVSFGLLHNCKDHKTRFVDRSRLLDIIFRIQHTPGRLSESEISYRRGRLRKLEKFLSTRCSHPFLTNLGNWQKNRWSILVAQAQFPWELVTLDEQITRLQEIFSEISDWIGKSPETISAINDLE